MVRTASNLPAPARRRAPGPESCSPLGQLQAIRRDKINFFLQVVEEYGDIVRLRFGPKIAHLIRHPDHVQHVLQDNNRNYTKQVRGYEKLKLILGEGLLTSEGEFWRRQRRIAQPAFHRSRVASFAGTMLRLSEDTARRWEPIAAAGDAVDVADEMMRLTLRIVAETLLSADLEGQAEEIGRSLSAILPDINDRANSVFSIPQRVPTPRNRRLQRAIDMLDRIVLGMIQVRRTQGHPREDLVAMLMEARDEETGEGMSDAQLRDEVMTIFLAGHETTANTLTWAWYLLSVNPEAGRRLRDELHEVLGGKPPSFEALPRLKYTGMVIKEALRLYPPAWFLNRLALQADEIGGYFIPKGSMVFISPYVTHRHPGFWPDPERFDPSRFDESGGAKFPRYAYIPFSGGPRICIGNNFAMMEAQIALATLAQRFEPRLVPGHPVELDPQITLRPKHGMRMTLHPIA